jgi:hypothetical protein
LIDALNSNPTVSLAIFSPIPFHLHCKVETMSSNNSTTETTLWKLPPQPLPAGNVQDGTFVTIWLFMALFFTLTIRHFLSSKREKKTWPEFWTIMLGTGFLFL